MAFIDSFRDLLPSNFDDRQKGKLARLLDQFKIDKEALKQVDQNKDKKTPEKNKSWSPKVYSDFYLPKKYDFFLQGDLLKEIRVAFWNTKTHDFEKKYNDAILLSNSCDITPDNLHGINAKQALFAPVREYNGYITYLETKGYNEEKIKSFEAAIKNQMFSNLLYLPKNTNENKEYIVWLDKIFWFPIDELNTYIPDIEQNRVFTLDLFGHYLFIIKLAYHLCRLPESPDRRAEFFHS
jgi:hypothetical protein